MAVRYYRSFLEKIMPEEGREQRKKEQKYEDAGETV